MPYLSQNITLTDAVVHGFIVILNTTQSRQRDHDLECTVTAGRCGPIRLSGLLEICLSIQLFEKFFYGDEACEK